MNSSRKITARPPTTTFSKKIPWRSKSGPPFYRQKSKTVHKNPDKSLKTEYQENSEKKPVKKIETEHGEISSKNPDVEVFTSVDQLFKVNNI